MKKLFNFIVVCLAVATVNLFSMDGDRPEAVITREHEQELVRAEQARRFQEEMQRFHQEREQARQRAMAHRQREIEQERRLAGEQVKIN